MKNFANIEDHSFEVIEKLIRNASILKKNKYNGNLKHKTMVGLFFNPSTRTRTSFDFAMDHQGGHFISLEPGNKSWGIDIEENVVMDGDNEEHLKEAVNVLARYSDCIGVRCFPRFNNWDYDRTDPVLENILKWSSVPVINMETISHPCQALAMLMTINEKFNFEKKKFVLSWSYHPKPLNTAVGNSALVAAAMAGMDVTVVNPPGYDLDEKYIKTAREFAGKNGGSVNVSHNQQESLEGADFVYVKSWGSLEQYGNFNQAEHDKYKNWIITPEKMAKTNNAYMSHCLPIRRNVVASDGVLDSKYSLIYEEAENRLHVQKAVLNYLIGGNL